MLNIKKANDILSEVDGGSSIVIVGRDGLVRFINSDNIGEDLLVIQNGSEKFITRLREEGVELEILGIYDELQVPIEKPAGPDSNDNKGYTKQVMKKLAQLSADEFKREQVLLLIPIDTLRLSWFRRPFGEPDETELMIHNSPVTESLRTSPEGTVNRTLVEAAISLRAAIL